MTIRLATLTDLDRMMEIYREAREMMAESGNPNQWPIGHPPRDRILMDIREGCSHVLVEGGKVLAVFCLSTSRDRTYDVIDGAWLDDERYGVVHRIARTKNEKAKGVGTFCLGWCYERIGNIRIDTHRDNIPMRRLLEKLGYIHCGTIWLENGDTRLAFQKN